MNRHVLILTLIVLFCSNHTLAQTWIESGDAGSLPDQAQFVTGTGPLSAIQGNLGPGDFQDLYLILIDDPINFEAATDNGVLPGGGAAFDTQLYLFGGEPFNFALGLLSNDDCFFGCPNFHSHLFSPATDPTNQDIPAPGLYLIGITGFDDNPLAFDGFQDVPIFNIQQFNEVSGPDGPGGFFPLSNWTQNNQNNTGPYTIAIQGASLVPLGWDCLGGNCVEVPFGPFAGEMECSRNCVATCQFDFECDDGNFCTINTCNTETMQCASVNLDCDDGDPCTNDFCDPGSGTCQHPIVLQCLLEPPCTECKEALKTAPCDCSGRDCGGPVALGDPVYLYSGEFYERAVDLQIKGRGLDFIWSRKYRSTIGPPTAQGNGWDFSYNIFVQPDGADLILHDGNTRADRYVFQPGTLTWTADGFFREFIANPDTSLTLVFEDGGTWEFAPLTDPVAPGRIAAIVDRNGNALGFEYDPSGRLAVIHDTLDTAGHNRDILIDYNTDGLIVAITDFTGRQVTYDYYEDGDAGGSAGDLKSVTTPPVIGTPHGNDFPGGKTTVYTYTTGFADEQLNHDLLTITDPRGQVYLQNVYAHTIDVLDPRHTQTPGDFYFGRVVRQIWGNPDDIMDYVFEPVVPDILNNFAVISTIVNDREGNVAQYFFDAGNRDVLMREYTGRWNADQPTFGGNLAAPPFPQLRAGDPTFFETRWDYNGDSLPLTVTHANGNQTVRVYDEINPNVRARGNQTQRCRLPGPLGGDQPSICETYEYEDGLGGCCGINFVTRHVDGRGNETLHEYDAAGNRTHTQHRIPSIVEDWEYNAFGQVTRHIHSDNGSGCRRVDAYTYYDESAGTQNGYRSTAVVDADTPQSCPGPHFELTSTTEYDAVGNITRRVDPRGHDSLFQFNALDERVREQSREVTGGGIRYERLTYFDANGNVVRIDVENRDEQGLVPDGNTHYTSVYEYEILNKLTRSCDESGIYVGAIPGAIELPTCSGLPEDEFITTEYTFDANRNRTRVIQGEAAEGRQPTNLVLTHYDERDLVYQVIRGAGDAQASTTQHDYDANGNLAAIREGLEDTPRLTTCTYDGYDRKTSTTDPMGNVRSCHYDPNGNTGGYADPAETMPHPFALRIMGELEDVPGSAGNVRLYEQWVEFDAMDRPQRNEVAFFDTQTQNPLNGGQMLGKRITTATYSAFSQITSVTNDNSNTRIGVYDTANRLLEVIDALGNSRSHTYDANSNLIDLTETELSGLAEADQVFSTTATYDNLDRMVTMTDNIGNSHAYGYDSRYNQTVTSDALGNQTRSRYDGINRVIETVIDNDNDGADGDGLDVVSTRTWDDSSRLVARTDDNGNVSRKAYDALDRLIVNRRADGTLHQIGDGAVWGPVAAVPNLGGFSSGYDVHDNRRTITDANGTVLIRSFDLLNRPDNATIDRAAIMDGDPLDVLGSTFELTRYDGLSRTVRTEDDDSVVLRNHDSLSRVTHETLNGQITVAAFDSVGNLLQCTYPGGRTIDCTFDALERKQVITDGGSPIASYDYVGPRRVRRVTFGNQTRSDWMYDGISGVPNDPADFGVRQVVRSTHQRIADGLIIDDRAYHWDAMYNKRQRRDLRAGGPQLTHDYTYDDLYRLTHTTVTTPALLTVRDTAYDLDGVGNRTQVLGAPDSGAAVGLYTMDGTAPDPADQQVNQYTTTPSAARQYDANGNLIAISGVALLAYDFRNQMVVYDDLATGRQHHYAYDASGRRIARIVDATGIADTTRYFYQDWQAIEEQDDAALTRATYVYGHGIDQVLSMRRAGNDFYYHSDDLGSVMALSDASGTAVQRFAYGDYGHPQDITCPWDLTADGIVNAADLAQLLGAWGPNPGHPADINVDGTVNAADLAQLLGAWGLCPPTTGNPLLFNGRRYDAETGWYYYRTRYLDPLAGRFTTRDIIGAWGDPANLGNDYTYLGNNPWSSIDPFGLAGDIKFPKPKADFADATTFTRNTLNLVKGTSIGKAVLDAIKKHCPCDVNIEIVPIGDKRLHGGAGYTDYTEGKPISIVLSAEYAGGQSALSNIKQAEDMVHELLHALIFCLDPKTHLADGAHHTLMGHVKHGKLSEVVHGRSAKLGGVMQAALVEIKEKIWGELTDEEEKIKKKSVNAKTVDDLIKKTKADVAKAAKAAGK